MPTQPNLEDKHVIEDHSTEQEEYSRTSSSSREEVHRQEELRSNDVIEGDKEAQLDARSTLTTESAIPPPPDGGLHAWLKVFGGFMIYINIWCVAHINNFLHAKTNKHQGFYTQLRRIPVLLQNHAT
jgi:hypothetical protein